MIEFVIKVYEIVSTVNLGCFLVVNEETFGSAIFLNRLYLRVSRYILLRLRAKYTLTV